MQLHMLLTSDEYALLDEGWEFYGLYRAYAMLQQTYLLWEPQLPLEPIFRVSFDSIFLRFALLDNVRDKKEGFAACNVTWSFLTNGKLYGHAGYTQSLAYFGTAT